jgi:hypothetical protein
MTSRKTFRERSLVAQRPLRKPSAEMIETESGRDGVGEFFEFGNSIKVQIFVYLLSIG